MEPFRIRRRRRGPRRSANARLRHTRWPDEVPGIGWEQGTELEWLRHLVAYWANEFDWRSWERKLNALNHFTWEGIHFVHWRAIRPGAPADPDPRVVGVSRLRGHAADARKLRRGRALPAGGTRSAAPIGGLGSPIAIRVSPLHRLMAELGYSRYGAGGGWFRRWGVGVSCAGRFQSAIGIPSHHTGAHPRGRGCGSRPMRERSYLAVRRGWDATERGYSAIQSTKPQTLGIRTRRLRGGTGRLSGREMALMERRHTVRRILLCATLTLYLYYADDHLVDARLLGEPPYPATPAYVDTPTAFGVFAHETVPEGGAAVLGNPECLYRDSQRWTVFPRGGHFAPVEEPAAVAGILLRFRDLG